MVTITYINTALTKSFLGLASLVLDDPIPMPNSKTSSEVEGRRVFFFISIFDILAKGKEMFICNTAATNPGGLYKVAQLV